MQALILYLGMMVVGAIVGSRKCMRNREFPWIGKVHTVALVILIFVLGVNIGTDDRVFDSLSEIGVAAVVVTVFVMVGSFAFVTIIRRLVGLDREGRVIKKDGEVEDE